MGTGANFSGWVHNNQMRIYAKPTKKNSKHDRIKAALDQVGREATERRLRSSPKGSRSARADGKHEIASRDDFGETGGNSLSQSFQSTPSTLATLTPTPQSPTELELSDITNSMTKSFISTCAVESKM